MTTWIRLEKANDWGAVYFARHALRGGMASSSRGIKPVMGTSTTVRMPAGDELVVEVRTTRQWSQVSDCGRDESFWQDVPCFLYNLGGLPVVLAIDAVDVSEEWWLSVRSQEDVPPEEDAWRTAAT